MALKRTSETKADNNWAKQALFLTFAQNKRIKISKALFISYFIQNHYNCKGDSIYKLTQTKFGLPVVWMKKKSPP